MKEKIITIEKGWGESSIYFTTKESAIGFPTYVHEIKQEWKTRTREGGQDCEQILVYRGYEQPNNRLIFEIEAGSDITLKFV